MKDMRPIFKALNNNRKAAHEARCYYKVYHIYKNGKLAQTPSAAYENEDRAHSQARYLESLNPGTTYVVREVR